MAPVEQFKTREVIVPTPGQAPTGGDYAHPVKLDYNNPITAVLAPDDHRYKFETKDGVASVHPGDTNNYKTRKEISPLASEIAKIKVWHNNRYIRGLRFYNKADAVVL